MGENMNENEEVRQQTSAQLQPVTIDEVQEAMKSLRINPRQRLESLSHLRINKARIKPIEGQDAMKTGGNADVEAAILISAQPLSSPEPDGSEYVAVKKLRLDTETENTQGLALFANEVGLLNDLSHPNVVKILGFVEDVSNHIAWMVFYWEKNGNLREFVRSEKWELPERVSLITDVARGLSYLHGRNPPICHGDLKSLNILVNSENRAVITDFGSARSIDPATDKIVYVVCADKATNVQHPTPEEVNATEPLKAEVGISGECITVTGPAWSVRWAAPELLQGEIPGLGSDVWAFGWICWEAFTGNFPFDNQHEGAVISRIVAQNIPTVRNNDQLRQMQTLCSLMEECWRLAPKDRPSAIRCQQVVSFMNPTIPFREGGHRLAGACSRKLLLALGRIQLHNGVIDQAQKLFRQSLGVCQSLGDEQGMAAATYSIGDAHTLQSQYSEAEESYIQSRDLYFKLGHQLGFAHSVKALGGVYRMRNEYSKAEESFVKSLDLYSKLGFELGVAHSIMALGDVYRSRNQYSQAEELYIQSRDVCDKIGNWLGFAQSVKALGDMYRTRNEYSKAEQSYIQSRDLYFRIGNQLGYANSVKALGEVYQMRNEYSKAEESYIQSRNVYSEIGNQLGFAYSVSRLGDIYRSRSQYSPAEESYIQSRDVYDKIGHQLGFANSVKALGEIYRMRKEYSKAEESYIQSRDLYSRIGNKLGFAQSVKALGDVNRMRHEYSKAEESYIQSRDLYSQIADQLGIANSVKALGDVYQVQDENSKAEESYIQSRDLYSKIGHQLGIANSLQGLGQVHSARTEYAKAAESYLEAQRIYKSIGDSYSSANTSWYLAWLHREQAQYEEAERLAREASIIYSKLGLAGDVQDCEEFLLEIRELMQA